MIAVAISLALLMPMWIPTPPVRKAKGPVKSGINRVLNTKKVIQATVQNTIVALAQRL